jgi:hypothetical protein
MADVPQDLSLIILAQEFRGDVVRQINRRVTALKTLRIVPGGGKNVSWVAEGDGAIGENHTDGEAAANFGSDAQDDAILSWGLYRSNFHVTKLAMDAAGSAMAPLGNRRLWARNQQNAMAKLADTLEIAAFNGAGTGTTIAGLDVAIGDDANTYAGIDRSSGSNAYWRPTVVDPGSLTAPTMAALRSDIGAIGDACGETPDLAFCSTPVFNAVAGLFDPNRRWSVLNTSRGKINLDAGYEGIEVDGCMFVKARRATVNRIYYVNSNFVHFEYLPDTQFPAEVYQQVQSDDGYGSVPLGMSFSMLSKLGPADRAQVLSTMQLVVTRPNACGVRKNVAV